MHVPPRPSFRIGQVQIMLWQVFLPLPQPFIRRRLIQINIVQREFLRASQVVGYVPCPGEPKQSAGDDDDTENPTPTRSAVCVLPLLEGASLPALYGGQPFRGDHARQRRRRGWAEENGVEEPIPRVLYSDGDKYTILQISAKWFVRGIIPVT
ncbi:hypothetical protein CPB84DRAFT_1222080 [Gymnopilus junonius]|uniref:Uncharacterized protein n=1 Tax=Gymnopilus junonius TaxID=109634 RepID=A0A9P5TTX6_GYMJU|nr:hypothetical protein CPB84DRAFT_1222080 [Gymnopilus junonius]